jgi:hypothetical protein
MNHRTLPRFWEDYKQLPKDILALADKNFELFKYTLTTLRFISKK